MKSIIPINSILFMAKVPATNASAVAFRESDNKSYKELAASPDDIPEAITLVSDGFDLELPGGSIAFHPIYGSVQYDYSWWRFSTRQFIENLAAAEANPSIVAHIIHVDSNGGESFGCHEAFEAVKNLQKPCYAVIESMAASAGYYLACATDKVYAASLFSIIGCIGTMCVMRNWTEYYKKHGVEEIEYYSNYSPLKNKVINDAIHGDGEEYVKRILDPLAYQFISDVRSVRPEVKEESDAAKGEIFYTTDALPAGLIDGMMTLAEAVQELEASIRKNKKAPSIDINQINL